MKDRLRDQGLEILRLPLGSNANENHVPIFVSKDLNTKKRVIVILGERSQDLGVFSYRVIGDKGINSGSAVEFCNAVLNSPSTVDDEGCPGIIITNPAQLHWYRRQARAVTYREWLNLPRTSAVHEAPRLDQKGNSIPHNRDYEEHVRYIFQHVLARLTRSDTCFDFIALECPGRAALQYLAKNCMYKAYFSEAMTDLISKGHHGLTKLAEFASGLPSILCKTCNQTQETQMPSQNSSRKDAVPTSYPTLLSKPQ